MKLYTRCSNCKKEIKLVEKSATRGDFQMKYGRDISKQCPHCLKDNRIHVNDIKAEKTSDLILWFLLGSLLIAVIAYFFYGWYALFVMSAPLGVHAHQLKEVKDFNSYKIKR